MYFFSISLLVKFLLFLSILCQGTLGNISKFQMVLCIFGCVNSRSLVLEIGILFLGTYPTSGSHKSCPCVYVDAIHCGDISTSSCDTLEEWYTVILTVCT